ncbi:MAG: DUF2188 domain-containing protein [Zoogloeaceae bacterium]|nr:DUF2188 domain-containing protein [Zoogloeaceae bacterium]
MRGEGNDRLTSIHDTQQQAIDRARDIAINQQSEMLIQGRNRGEPSGSCRPCPEWLAHAERRANSRGVRKPQTKTPNRERLGAE